MMDDSLQKAECGFHNEEKSNLVHNLNRVSIEIEENTSRRTSVNQNIVFSYKICWRQIIAACVAHSIVIQVGVNMAFSAILLPQLSSVDSDIKINLNEASWIASLVAIALPIGSLSVGPLMDRWGRRLICMFSCIPFMIAFLITATAQSLTVLYFARILSGVAGGLSTSAIVYVSEVSIPEIRPVLLCLNSVFVSLGILITCVLSLWLKWRTIAGVCGLLTLTSCICMWCMPETPHWIYTFKKNDKSIEKSLKWLYINTDLYNRESRRFKIQEEKDEIENEVKPLLTSNSLKVYQEPAVYKPFFILIVLFIMQQASGAYVIIFYAVDLFKTTGGRFAVNADEYVSLVLLGTIRFIMSVIAAGISRRCGRRPLLMTSALGMSLSALITGLYLRYEGIPKEENPIVVICILSYVCFSALGILVIPWALIGELLPVKVRGKLGGVMVALAYLFMFIAVKIWPSSLQLLTAPAMFIVLSLTCFFNVIFVWYCLPETLGKNFSQIEKYFH